MKKIAMILAVGIARFASAETLPGMPLDHACSGLLKSARIETQNDWDFSFNLAFNEYYVVQEGLALAAPLGFTESSPVAFDFKYHPGFQVGFTLNTPYDGWTFAGDYLWVRASNHVSGTAPGDDSFFDAFAFGSIDNFVNPLTAKWTLSMDLADLYLVRPFYFGTAWTVDPFFGFRGGWIRQYLHVVGIFGSPLQSSFKSGAWLLGPRGGFQSNWLLGKGFSLFGNLSASLLYTRYTTLAGKNQQDSVLLVATENGANGLTPNIDTGLGVKWGAHFSGQPAYIDFSAAYNFSVFFSQGQIGYLATTMNTTGNGSAGRLYLHGVSLATSLFF